MRHYAWIRAFSGDALSLERIYRFELGMILKESGLDEGTASSLAQQSGGSFIQYVIRDCKEAISRVWADSTGRQLAERNGGE
jgi:hypothetical protein